MAAFTLGGTRRGPATPGPEPLEGTPGTVAFLAPERPLFFWGVGGVVDLVLVQKIN